MSEEDKSNKMYLHMYSKDQEVASTSSSTPSLALQRVTVPDLLHQLQVTQDELENIKVSLRILFQLLCALLCFFLASFGGFCGSFLQVFKKWLNVDHFSHNTHYSMTMSLLSTNRSNDCIVLFFYSSQ